MILLESNLALPSIKRFSKDGNKTVVIQFGLFKITWLNFKLSQLFLTVISMGLNNLDKIVNHDVEMDALRNKYEDIIKNLEHYQEELLEDNAALKESVQNLTMEISSKRKKKSKVDNDK